MTETNGQNIGRVTQIIGSTLDAEFEEDHLPAIYNALKVDIERKVMGHTTRDTLWCEVASHLGGGSEGVQGDVVGRSDGDGTRLERGAQEEDGAGPRAPEPLTEHGAGHGGGFEDLRGGDCTRERGQRRDETREN